MGEQLGGFLTSQPRNHSVDSSEAPDSSKLNPDSELLDLGWKRLVLRWIAGCKPILKPKHRQIVSYLELSALNTAV